MYSCFHRMHFGDFFLGRDHVIHLSLITRVFPGCLCYSRRALECKTGSCVAFFNRTHRVLQGFGGREMNTSNLEKLKGSSEELVCVRACVFSSGCCGFLDVGCGVGTWTDGNWCTLKEAKNLQLSNSHLLIFRFKEIPHDREINGLLLKQTQQTQFLIS